MRYNQGTMRPSLCRAFGILSLSKFNVPHDHAVALTLRVSFGMYLVYYTWCMIAILHSGEI